LKATLECAFRRHPTGPFRLDQVGTWFFDHGKMP
jgi:hypothetical protein